MRPTRRLWLVGTAAAVAAPTLVRADEPLKVAVLPTTAATPFYYALHAGLFERAGLDVDFVSIASGNLAIQAAVAGAVQVGLTNTLSLAQAHAHGIPLDVIFGAGYHSPDEPITWLFVAADGTLRTAKDLEGHVVAVPGLHDLGTLSVRAWLAQGGADSTRIRFIELPEGQMLAALQQKRVDAFTSFEPFATAVVQSRTARAIGTPFDAIAPRFDVTVWCAYGPYVAANRQRLERFVGVMREATTYANAHLGDLVPIVATYTKMTVETVRRGLHAKTALDPHPSDLQPVIDVAARFGELSAAFPAQEILPSPPL